MKYNLTLNYNEEVYLLNEDEHDLIMKLSTDGRTTGAWVQGSYISFSSIKNITPCNEPEYNNQQLPEAKDEPVTEDRLVRRRRMFLEALHDEVGDSEFYKEIKKKIEYKQKIGGTFGTSSLNKNLGL